MPSLRNTYFEKIFMDSLGIITRWKYLFGLNDHEVISHFLYYRFGVIGALKSKKYIKKDQELFVSYDYQIKTAPLWYIKFYKEFIEENNIFVSQSTLNFISKTLQNDNQRI